MREIRRCPRARVWCAGFFLVFFFFVFFFFIPVGGSVVPTSSEFDLQTLAVLRGRLVRYLMRSREVSAAPALRGFPLRHSLAHSLTRSLIHVRTHARTHARTHSLTPIMGWKTLPQQWRLIIMFGRILKRAFYGRSLADGGQKSKYRVSWPSRNEREDQLWKLSFRPTESLTGCSGQGNATLLSPASSFPDNCGPRYRWKPRGRRPVARGPRVENLQEAGQSLVALLSVHNRYAVGR